MDDGRKHPHEPRRFHQQLNTHPIDQWIKLETRRQFFGRSAKGLGAAALASLLGGEAAGQTGGVLGGGQTAAAAEQAGVVERLSHVSTGGGASLALLAGAPLPGVESLSDRE